MGDGKEREAMEWLEKWTTCKAGEFVEITHAAQHARTLKAMLAEPRLPKWPTGASDAIGEAISEALRKAAIDPATHSGYHIMGQVAVNALYQHLTAPRTKEETFTRWLVVAPGNEYGPYTSFAEALGVASMKRGVLVELTGTAKVPQ